MEALPGGRVVHLDTHVAMWLLGDVKRNLRPIRHRLDGASLAISPMVLVELQLLHELGRFRFSASAAERLLAEPIGVTVASVSFADVARQAQALSWTRDPFDRLIVATALAANAPLVTRDEIIQANCPLAVWE